MLLVGSNGNIGKFLSEQFDEIYQVHKISYSPSKFSKNFTQLDLSNKRAVMEYVEKCGQFEVIVFLVGLAHSKGNKKSHNKYKKSNLNTVINLMDALQQKSKLPDKFVFMSTISVYGERLGLSSYGEDVPKIPRSPYSMTKLEAESFLLKNLFKKVWILRLAPVYSTKFRLNINRRMKILGIPFKVGSGSARFSLCNILNISIALKGVINDKIPPGVYNISDKRNYDYTDLLKLDKVKIFIPIPVFIVKTVYRTGLFFNNIYLMENSLKLIKNNIYPSKRVSRYVDLEGHLFDKI